MNISTQNLNQKITNGERKALKRVGFTAIIILGIYGLGKVAKLILEYLGFLQEV